MENKRDESPWPEASILNYSNVEDGGWGYLIIYPDLTYEFDNSRVPTKEEILSRWGYRFKDSR